MKNFKLITIITLVVLFATSCLSEQSYKKYIVEHKSEIVKSVKNPRYFTINKYDGLYYKNVSLRLCSDSSYTVIFWGDRNSKLWNLKHDKIIDVDLSIDLSELDTYDVTIFTILKYGK